MRAAINDHSYLIGSATPALHIVPIAFSRLPGAAQPDTGLAATGYSPSTMAVAYGTSQVNDTKGDGQTTPFVDA
jgi:hypothetical protein